MTKTKEYKTKLQIQDKAQFLKQIQNIDQLIKNLEIKTAKKQFAEIAKSNIPRSWLVDVCQLARRLNLPSIILKKLHPIVNSDLKEIQPTDLELALYCVGLYLNGAYQEAEKKLTIATKNNSTNNPTNNPINNPTEAQIYFIKALCYMRQWKYQKAIGPLFKFQKLVTPNSYDYLLSELNLAACYQALGSSSLALKHLDMVFIQTEYLTLKAASYELYAQILFSQNKYVEALAALNSNIDKTSYFFKKWFYLIQYYNHPNEVSLNDLMTFRNIALTENQFEIARDIDFHYFLQSKDFKSLLKLKKCSHFKSYQYRIQAVIPPKMKLHFFEVNDGLYPNQKNKYDIFFHSANIQINHQEYITLNGLLKKLFQFLLTELYSQFQLGEIFSFLYPNEYFNYHSSPKRVLRLLFRLQMELKKLPNKAIQIQIQKNKVKIVFNQQITIHYKKR